MIRYQLRELAGVATYEALPAKASQSPSAVMPGASDAGQEGVDNAQRELAESEF